MSSSRISYTLRPDVTPNSELDALAAVYRFVLSHSQASKGGSHDLTSDFTTEMLKNGPRKTEQEKT